DLDRLEAPPDVIHGHHHLTTMTALLRFAPVPAVYVFHGALSWHDVPPRFPRILRYVAVDETCRDLLAFEHGIPEERLRVMLNWVDLARFVPRGPLPARPRRALIFSNEAHERTHLPAVREACGRAGLPFDVIGAGAGNVVARPEEVLGRYDLVFAKAKCALEALAVGAAVVLCDYRGAGPMVTVENLAALRRLNFGIRTLAGPLCPEGLGREMCRYDAADAAEVSRRIRATAGLGESLDALIGLYQEVLDEHAALAVPPDLAAEERAAATYFRRVAPHFAELDQRRAEVASLRAALEVRAAVPIELESIKRTATWRLRDRLRGIPLAGRLLGALARLAARRSPS
ncbi:MAG TPA: glycosyltransferase family 4 protein, partial [Candidatus Methylomirabilis sp.]